MKEQEPNWFSNWDQHLPNPEDLIPLSQTLITPDLATAFGIITTTTPHNQQQPQTISTPNSNEFDSSELGGDEPNRTLKRPRLVWTPQLHKKFVDAVAYLGIKNAVPKTIMQLMSVDGLTRENVASHLQKYRLYLKRMQGFSSGASGDAATDRLFASQPVPAHFLQQMHPGFENMVPYVPVGVLQQQQLQQQQMVGGYVNRQFGLARQGSQPVGMGAIRNGYTGGDQECGNEKRALTLFPTGD